MITPELIQAILKQYQLSRKGIHGPIHWARVLENGRKLAALTGARLEVVELFAVFHDSCRRNDGFDPEHGSRGAKLAAQLRRTYFNLDDADFACLSAACRLHTSGLTEADVTVQTCWDSDRLDLGRVGVKPHPKRLCTQAARDSSMIAWADNRAASGYVPAFVDGWSRGAVLKAEVIK